MESDSYFKSNRSQGLVSEIIMIIIINYSAGAATQMHSLCFRGFMRSC